MVLVGFKRDLKGGQVSVVLQCEDLNNSKRNYLFYPRPSAGVPWYT